MSNKTKNAILDSICRDLQLAKNINYDEMCLVGSLIIDGDVPKTFFTGIPGISFIGIASQINMLSQALKLPKEFILNEVKSILKEIQ